MLIRFTIENFLSFRDREVFSLIPGKGTLKPQHKAKPIKGISVLKAAVLFGANASGKSNLVKAIELGRRLVVEGTKAEQPISFDFFKLDKQRRKENARIEYELQHKNKNYAYGFIFNAREIVEEWLFEIGKKSEAKIFERRNSNQFDLAFFKKKNKKEEFHFIEYVAKATPKNQLFLNQVRSSNVAENVGDIEDVFNVIDWFQNTLNIVFPNSMSIRKKIEFLVNADLQKIFTEMLDYFDTGIDGIEFQEIEFEKINVPEELKTEIRNGLLGSKMENASAILSNIQDDKYFILTKKAEDQVSASLLKTRHKTADGTFELFDLKDESDGTRRIMDLIPMIIDFFQGGSVFVIDEMERSLHPNLVYDLFDFFLSHCENISSQFIVASHESSLLTQKLLRKDEIWFVVKESEGISRLHSLEEYNIRFDKEVRRDYLLGRYKGVPRLGNRNNLTVLTLNEG